jgi:phage N-6-adenine-methyltransferase
MSKWKTAGMVSSLREDWATPRKLVETLRREFRFTVDVCARPETAVCRRFFTVDDDGLSQDWVRAARGGVAWMNPPYGRAIGRWLSKAASESKRGATVVCLLPARTDTTWFHDFCVGAEVRFLRGRLNFDDQLRRDARAPFPSVIVVFRPDNDLHA